MKEGDAKGYPVMRDGDVIASYEHTYDGDLQVPEYRANSLKPHPEIPFCRYATLTDALKFLRNTGEPPVQVRAKDMPTGQTWNNFAPNLYRLHAKVCSNEGLARTSVMARKYLLYFFYGSYMWTTKNSKKQTVQKIKPFVFFLHKKMVAQRSRFVSKVIM